MVVELTVILNTDSICYTYISISSMFDMLTSISSTFDILQAKVDIVSAICIIFGLNLADAKFRAFVSIFGTGVQHVKCINMAGLSMRWNYSWMAPSNSWVLFLI